jgi:hypothetical protein
MSAHLDRVYNPEVPNQLPTSPTLLYTLPQLEENLKVRYSAVLQRYCNGRGHRHAVGTCLPCALADGHPCGPADGRCCPPTPLHPRARTPVQAAYKFVTEGKFSDALKVFTRMLHVIPLTYVESRKEVDDVKELLGIAKEYSIALR